MKSTEHRRGHKGRKCELLRAIERPPLLQRMERAVADFKFHCWMRQNRRTARELERRGAL